MSNTDIEKHLAHKIEEINNFLDQASRNREELQEQLMMVDAEAQAAERDLKRCHRALEAVRGTDETTQPSRETKMVNALMPSERNYPEPQPPIGIGTLGNGTISGMATPGTIPPSTYHPNNLD